MNAPTEITFLLTISIITLITCIFAIVAATPHLAPKITHSVQWSIISIIIDALLMVCWFGGFIALPIFLRARVCWGNVCRMAYASVIFASVEWALLVVTLVWSTVELIKKRSNRRKTPSEDDEEEFNVKALKVEIIEKS